MNVTIDLADSPYRTRPQRRWNVIFPATGYLMLAWRRLAASLGRVWAETPVLFQNVQFIRSSISNGI